MNFFLIHLEQYRNSCHLRRAECKQGKKIGTIEKERCNPFNSSSSFSTRSETECKSGMMGNYTGCQLSRPLSSTSTPFPPSRTRSCPAGERLERESCLPCLCSKLGSLGPQCDQKGVCACRWWHAVRNHILRLICYGRYCLLVAGPTGTDGTVTDVKMNFLVAGDDHNESDDCEEGSGADIFYSGSRVQ